MRRFVLGVWELPDRCRENLESVHTGAAGAPRASILAVRVCPNCGEGNPDRAKFCLNCATPLEEPTATRETRKVVTVLFTDVTGFTSLGEQLDPESLRNVMSRFFDAMREAVERHGGVVEKFIGDAVMAVFGIPRLHEDDPIRAVRAAKEMQHALTRLNDQLQNERGVTLQIHTGITTGEVVAGDPSAGQRLVTGDTVNTAARLEQAAAPGEILIGEPTHRLTRDAVTVEPVDTLQLKGKAGAVSAYRLLEVSAGEAHARHLDSPMVGRDREFHLLTQALDRAVSEQTAHLFTLLGPAGVGKSRLTLEFLTRAAEGATILTGRCLSYGEGITFFPLAEVIRKAAGITDDDSSQQAKQKIERALGPDTDQSSVIATGVAELAGFERGTITSEDAFWAVRTFLESLARTSPLVVLFDDVHWAEPALLDLVEHVADWSRDAPILLLAAARPELLDLRPGWGGGKMNATSILLEPLGPEDATTLIDNLLGEAEGLPAQARRRILEAAEGNPLFVEEMLGMLVDDGLLRREDGRWVASAEVERIAIPPTIQLLLAARLDRLDAEERGVAERASVEGKVFHRGAVIRLSPDGERAQVASRLLALARKELIRPDRAQFAGQDAFRFRHLLIRDAAYHGMPKEARAELHEVFADWLEEQAGKHRAEYEDILGYHLEQAFRYRQELGRVDEAAAKLGERAGKALASAARRAVDKQDWHAAANLLRRSIELTPETSSDHQELRYELIEALRESGDLEEASVLADQLLEHARQAGDRRLEALSSIQRAWFQNSENAITLGAMVATAVEARRVLEELGDVRGVLTALGLEAFGWFAQGRLDEARGAIIARLDRATEVGDMRHAREAATSLAGNLFWGNGTATDILAEVERLMPVVADSPTATSLLLIRLPLAHAMLGRFEEARQAANRAREACAQIGNPMNTASGALSMFSAYRLTGDWAQAERESREATAFFEAAGNEGFQSTSVLCLAEAVAAQGRFVEAEELAERGRSLTGQDDAIAQMQWRNVMAMVLAARGELEEAERLDREAVEIGDRTGWINERGDAWMKLADVLREAGKDDEAAGAFRAAVELYERKGSLVGAERARQQLGPAPSDI
jgi:class 3 adenylate cyclase/tetratricopeptide (TPR) repeat protein